MLDLIKNKTKVDDIVASTELSSYEKLEKLFEIYQESQSKYAFKRMNDLNKSEIIESYLATEEAINFKFACGWKINFKESYFRFGDFLDTNFGQYRKNLFDSFNKLNRIINRCAESFYDAYEDIYSDLEKSEKAEEDIVGLVAEIIKTFIIHHGFEKTDIAQRGIASHLGFDIEYHSVDSLLGKYLWMFKENSTAFLADFLPEINTRILNYIEKGVKFGTVPYDELTSLSEFNLPYEVLKEQHDAISSLCKTILENPYIVGSIKRNSDQHMLQMFVDYLNRKETPKEESIGMKAIDIACYYLNKDRREAGEKMFDSFPHIPEIMMQANSVCAEIFADLQSEDLSPEEVLEMAPIWCAYAGIGAVAKWNDDWDSLKAKGIIPSLTKSRGYFAMDEYIMDYTGIGWGSEESKKLRGKLRKFTETLLEYSFNNGEFNSNQYFECLKAMYLYGMAYEMKQLNLN